MITRYIWTDEKMFDADDGDFVTYADHLRAVGDSSVNAPRSSCPWQFQPTPEGWECDAELFHNDRGYAYKFSNSIDVPTGELLADALNVHEATGLTPSQLQARVAELEAALAAERGACASICDEMAEHWSAYKDSALLNGGIELSNTASGEPRAAAALASLIRGRA